MKCALITLSLVSALVIAGALLAISQFNLSAMPEPGKLETYLATSAIHVLVHRSSREPIPAAPSNLKASTEEGDKLFGTECAACHGIDGHKSTDAGRWMYPRASLLGPPIGSEVADPRVITLPMAVEELVESAGLHEAREHPEHPLLTSALRLAEAGLPSYRALEQPPEIVVQVLFQKISLVGLFGTGIAGLYFCVVGGLIV